MPLDGEKKRMFEACFERLDDAVGRAPGKREIVRDAANPLVMQRVRRDPLAAEDPGESPARQANLVDARVVARSPVARQIFYERPAESDVGDLQAAADAEQRKPQLARAPYEGDLERVAFGVRRVDRCVADAAVQRGIDVDPAGDDDRVEPGGVVVEARQIVLERLGARAQALERRDVGRRLVDEDAPRVSLARVRDADQRDVRP